MKKLLLLVSVLMAVSLSVSYGQSANLASSSPQCVYPSGNYIAYIYFSPVGCPSGTTCTILEWVISGNYQLTNGTTLTSSSISVYWTSPGSPQVYARYTAGSYTGDTNILSFNIQAASVATVNISRSPTGTINYQTPVEFDATPSGTMNATPTYQWYLNNQPLSGQTTTSYSTSSLQNNDQVFVKMYNNSTCANPTFDDSDILTVNVNYPISGPPTVSNKTIAYNSSTSLTASGAASGEHYRWYETQSGGTYAGQGFSFSTPVLTDHKTYYVSIKNITTPAESARVPQSITLVVPPPTLPSMSTNTCGPKTLTRGNPPANITWYWVGTDPNATSLNAAATLTVAEAANQPYYLRAKANTAEIWSTAIGIKVTTDPVDIVVDSYSPQNSLIQATHSITILPGPSGFTVPAGSTFTARIAITNAECNDIYNWTESIVYDQQAQPLARTKTYVTGLGEVMQSQAKDYGSGKVWASQPLYGFHNSVVGETMAAPILEHDFIYKKKFAANPSGQPYGVNDFDTPSILNNPAPVGTLPGTLGWYYSSSNNLEPQTPVTSYPYGRSYTPPVPDPTTSKSAAPGDQYKMGSGHEVESQRYITTTQLNHYLSLRSHFVTSSVPVTGYYYITTDPDEKQIATFVDSDGRTLAAATYNGSAFDNWSYSYYNDLGQLIATVAPKGVVPGNAYPSYVTLYKYDHLGRLIETTSTDEGISRFVYSTDGKIRFSENSEQRSASPKRFSYTNYDYLGRLIESGEYTANATPGEPFVFDMSTPSGSNSILYLVDNIGFTGISRKLLLQAARCSDYNFITYDYQADDFPSAITPYDKQVNTMGQVTTTKNAHTTTWYSYDEFGQLHWTKQYINDLATIPDDPAAYKTIEYTYDYYGNVTQVAYQKGNTTDDFYHYYEYDKNQRLNKVYTSTDGSTKTLQAAYYYYLHGPLKRVELGGNIQGVDYVYNIDGSLKLINHPDPTKDPGTDGISGSHASFMKDVFGEALDYNTNDYTGAGFNEGSLTLGAPYTDKFGGAVKSIRWHSPTDNHVPHAYGFTYDNLNQMNDAVFGNITGTFGSGYGVNFPSSQLYKEDVGGYDKNGNITGLVRKGKTGNTVANYTYNYTANTNKLASVTGGALSYEYNLIGQMKKQVDGSKTFNVKYNAYGLVKEIRNAADTRSIVKYKYDDRGNRIIKALHDPNLSSNPEISSTYYVYDAGGNVLATYEKIGMDPVKLIEVPIYAAGRVAMYKPQVTTTFYEVSDHLGNVRGVIGKPETQTFTATMEDNETVAYSNPRVQEMAYFENISATAMSDDRFNHTLLAEYTPSTAEPAPTYSSYLEWANETEAAQTSIGPAIGLKVEPGDKLNIEAWAKYRKKTSYSNGSIAGAMASILGNAFVGSAPGLDILANATQTFSNGLGMVTSEGTDTSVPYAYVYYLLYDRSFTPVTWGRARVTINGGFEAPYEATSAHEKLTIPTVNITEPGYIYVFVTNKSPATEVWFDDLKVIHEHSNIVAGADYYPFGLVMENREITREDYRYGYQGQFSEKDLTTGQNEFELRNYDARIGRWLSPDPYGQYASPYMAMGNNPHMNFDPDGGFSTGCPPACVTFVEGIGYVGAEIVIESSKLFSIAASSGLFTAAELNVQAHELNITGSISQPQGQFESYSEPQFDLLKPNTSDLTSLISMPSAATIQNVAGIAGLIPGVNTVAGIVEAGAAIAAGDYWGAGFAVAGAIPVVGVAVKLGKLAYLATRTTRIYRIWDHQLGTAHKFGISSGILGNGGSLLRLKVQLALLNRGKNGGRYTGKVVSEHSTRAQALYYEKVHTALYKTSSGFGRIPLGMQRPNGQFPLGYPNILGY